MGVTDQQKESSSGRSILFDPKVRGIFFQVVLIVGLVLFFYWIIGNTVDNLARQNKNTGFGFFESTAGFAIAPTLGVAIMDYAPGESSYFDAFMVGLINTALLAFVGIIFATIIGFLVGIARLSNNFVIYTVATVYVETLRNIPLLLQLFFWYFAVLRQVPGKKEKWSFFNETMHLNITGFWGPAPIPQQGFSYVVIAVLAAVAIAFIFSKWAGNQQAKTGKQFPSFLIGLSIMIGLPLITYYIMGRPLNWEFPHFISEGSAFKRGFEQGTGLVIIPEFIAMFLALSFYTASFIAEIVRAGILSVAKGQTEAANALGLRQGPTLRLVIIPQALRVIIPPLTSQYLNLTKNSSLAVAIAYPELVSIFAGTSLQKIGQEVEVIFVTMMVYLTFSILTSLFMNWYNARIKLTER